MKLFDKRNIVLIMSIFLLLLMVSSVSAADVSEDAVIGNDAAIDTITSTDTDSGSIDDVISAEVSDNPKVDPSGSNESLSGDIVADASSNNDNSGNRRSADQMRTIPNTMFSIRYYSSYAYADPSRNGITQLLQHPRYCLYR